MEFLLKVIETLTSRYDKQTYSVMSTTNTKEEKQIKYEKKKNRKLEVTIKSHGLKGQDLETWRKTSTEAKPLLLSLKTPVSHRED